MVARIINDIDQNMINLDKQITFKRMCFGSHEFKINTDASCLVDDGLVLQLECANCDAVAHWQTDVVALTEMLTDFGLGIGIKDSEGNDTVNDFYFCPHTDEVMVLVRKNAERSDDGWVQGHSRSCDFRCEIRGIAGFTTDEISEIVKRSVKTHLKSSKHKQNLCRGMEPCQDPEVTT